MGEFQREVRYIVFKVSDFETVATSTERAVIEILAKRIDASRVARGKGPMSCVVVEADWPEYETTWKLIEARVSGGALPSDDGVREVVETIRSILVTTVPEDMEEVDDLVIGTVQIRSMRKVAERIAAEVTRQTKEMREALNKIAFTEVVQSDFKNWQRAKQIASQALANKGD